MSYPFEPTTTKKLKEFLKEYLEKNCKSQETDQEDQRASDLKKRNKLNLLSSILESWRRRLLES